MRAFDVRVAAAMGATAVVEEFVTAVHEQLSLEHRQWLEGGESTRSAVAKLEEALKRMEDDRAGKLGDLAASPTGG